MKRLKLRSIFVWYCVGFVAVSVVVVYNSYDGGSKANGKFDVAVDDETDEATQIRKILLDSHCINRLEQNQLCKYPVRIGVFRNQSIFLRINRKRFSVTHFIEQNAKQDFTWFKPTKKGGKRRIVVNTPFILQNISFEDGSQKLLFVPQDKASFLRKWLKSEYIACSGKGVRNRTVDNIKRVIPLSAVRNVMAEFRDFADANNNTAYLFGGSLLGWYRECSIIPHTTDIDYGMNHIEHSDEFEALMEKRYVVYWMQGAGNETGLITYHKDEVKTDLFFVFPHNDTHSYTNGFLVPEEREIRWLIPKVTRICSTNLLDNLMYVPCNAAKIILSDYGPNWMIDAPSKNYHFQSSGNNIIEGRRFNETEWERVYRWKQGFWF
ncbi:unnamed protein product [Bursaphelenchus xylophilus]|uniref:(pine wood nematode) hypothetical protein n=1 Tax=Bursaphelenchus xylophilus TaxID=6326 RepID=A0A1I7RUT7_BURXY|nr:unnamed protein product [Bursaphelenchus xylophilus]CAG9105466.1 unnamed protein product [Bursaphelenchus xylophilus]